MAALQYILVENEREHAFFYKSMYLVRYIEGLLGDVSSKLKWNREEMQHRVIEYNDLVEYIKNSKYTRYYGDENDCILCKDIEYLINGCMVRLQNMFDYVKFYESPSVDSANIVKYSSDEITHDMLRDIIVYGRAMTMEWGNDGVQVGWTFQYFKPCSKVFVYYYDGTMCLEHDLMNKNGRAVLIDWAKDVYNSIRELTQLV